MTDQKLREAAEKYAAKLAETASYTKSAQELIAEDYLAGALPMLEENTALKERNATLQEECDYWRELFGKQLEITRKLQEQIAVAVAEMEAVKKMLLCESNKEARRVMCDCPHSCFVRFQGVNVVKGRTLGGDDKLGAAKGGESR